jgi:hypothetical protein
MKKLNFFFVLVFLASCQKNQLEGSSTINGKALHHTTKIPFCRIFIKTNATEFPGTDSTKYDGKYKADAEGNYSIKCSSGNYYLYGVGYDVVSKEAVSGGIPIKMRQNETRNVDVPVTE